MLQKHRAHESATRVGIDYMETMKLDDHFRLGMLNLMKEKKSNSVQMVITKKGT